MKKILTYEIVYFHVIAWMVFQLRGLYVMTTKNTPELPDEITTETMFGDYTGKRSAVTQSGQKKLPPKTTKQTKEWLLQHMSITIPYILKNFPSKILSCPSLKMKPQQTKS